MFHCAEGGNEIGIMVVLVSQSRGVFRKKNKEQE